MNKYYTLSLITALSVVSYVVCSAPSPEQITAQDKATFNSFLKAIAAVNLNTVQALLPNVKHLLNKRNKFFTPLGIARSMELERLTDKQKSDLAQIIALLKQNGAQSVYNDWQGYFKNHAEDKAKATYPHTFKNYSE